MIIYSADRLLEVLLRTLRPFRPAESLRSILTGWSSSAHQATKRNHHLYHLSYLFEDLMATRSPVKEEDAKSVLCAGNIVAK